MGPNTVSGIDQQGAAQAASTLQAAQQGGQGQQWGYNFTDQQRQEGARLMLADKAMDLNLKQQELQLQKESMSLQLQGMKQQMQMNDPLQAAQMQTQAFDAQEPMRQAMLTERLEALKQETDFQRKAEEEMHRTVLKRQAQEGRIAVDAAEKVRVMKVDHAKRRNGLETAAITSEKDVNKKFNLITAGFNRRLLELQQSAKMEEDISALIQGAVERSAAAITSSSMLGGDPNTLSPGTQGYGQALGFGVQQFGGGHRSMASVQLDPERPLSPELARRALDEVMRANVQTGYSGEEPSPVVDEAAGRTFEGMAEQTKYIPNFLGKALDWSLGFADTAKERVGGAMQEERAAPMDDRQVKTISALLMANALEELSVGMGRMGGETKNIYRMVEDLGNLVVSGKIDSDEGKKFIEQARASGNLELAQHIFQSLSDKVADQALAATGDQGVLSHRDSTTLINNARLISQELKGLGVLLDSNPLLPDSPTRAMKETVLKDYAQRISNVDPESLSRWVGEMKTKDPESLRILEDMGALDDFKAGGLQDELLRAIEELRANREALNAWDVEHTPSYYDAVEVGYKSDAIEQFLAGEGY